MTIPAYKHVVFHFNNIIAFTNYDDDDYDDDDYGDCLLESCPLTSTYSSVPLVFSSTKNERKLSLGTSHVVSA